MKSYRFIVVFCLLAIILCLMGCRPRGILSSREMRRVLVDLHMTDAIIQVSGVRATSTEAKDIYYAETLERHGVTQAQFDSSLVWYTAHPQFFNKIYPKVMKDLEAAEAAFLAEHEASLYSTGREVDKSSSRTEEEFTVRQLDSMLWVVWHGWSHDWQRMPDSLMHNLENQFFPQIGVTSGWIVDTLQTSVEIPEVAHD